MAFVENWDTGKYGAAWDTGLQWDVNVGPAIGDVQPYLNLVTSEHNTRPKFMSTLAAVLQPFADSIAILQQAAAAFDLDTAVGSQEDAIGEWVGISRQVAVPLPNVFFAFDTVGLGFDHGTWFGPGDILSGLVVLPDGPYRTLLRARIANNQWDGTLNQAYTAWNTLFAGTGIGIMIQDGNDMTMVYGLTGPAPDAVTVSLLKGGYLDLKPAGVRITSYMIPSAPNTPFFGFDANSATMGGFDTGSWATPL